MPLPIEFLLECSDRSRQDFELNALCRAANFRKTMLNLQEEMIRCEAEALLARWITEHRAELVSLGRTYALQKVLDFRGSYGPNRQSLGNPVKRLG